MKIVFILVLVCIAISGSAIFRAGIQSLVIAIRRRPHLQRIMGTILTVEKVREVRPNQRSKGRYVSSIVVSYYPLIHFTAPDGQAVRFRSELGESYRLRKKFDGTVIEPKSRYRDGQRIEVFYDTTGELKPCIANWWGLYFNGAGMLAAGVAFVGLSVVLWFCFSPRVFAI